MTERWTELKRTSEGVSFTLYEQDGDRVSIVDETWWTWDEFLGMDVAPDMDFGGDGRVMVLEGDE